MQDTLDIFDYYSQIGFEMNIELFIIEVARSKVNVLQSSVKTKTVQNCKWQPKTHVGWHAVSVYMFASCQFSNTCIAYQTGVNNKILLRILRRGSQQFIQFSIRSQFTK